MSVGLIGTPITLSSSRAKTGALPPFRNIIDMDPGREKESFEGFGPAAIKHLCQRMSHVTSYNSLAKSSLLAPPSYKETRKCDPICLEGRELEVFGD